MASELDRMTGASFERLVRALCFRRFGPAGMVFSQGPDGGRDFTFDGVVPGYEARHWHGYMIVQCKYLQEQRGSQANVAWLIKQLNAEYKKLRSKNAGVKAPNYYVIATNISLSGADSSNGSKNKKSGFSKVAETLEKWKTGIGLVDYDIWPGDKIVDLLADAADVRQTFAAWVTPGDVLTYWAQHFQTRTTNFQTLLKRAMSRSLRRDQYIRLKDAGSVSDLQIKTSQVFVDLPVLEIPRPNKSVNALWAGLGQEYLVSKICEVAKGRFDRDLTLPLLSGARTHKENENLFVVLGGPGQGKSTLSLFLAQIFRASILEFDEAANHNQLTKQLIVDILGRAESEGVSRFVPRRFPVHISLPKYADTVTQARKQDKEIPSVIEYIVGELSKAADEVLSKGDLRSWLQQYPWIVVFDGLDEVPSSGERTTVIDAINDFVSESIELNSDTLMIVTTRPQGYNSDLSSEVWSHWHLTDLPAERAMRYAEAFSQAQYADDGDRVEDIVSKLRAASTQQATSRLMITPLQVTILCMIVDTGGSVPTARWSLFNEYFEILKKREKAKGGETQAAIEKNVAYLSPIHHRAGLILQTDSEHTGNANSSMSHDCFSRLLTDYLSEEGYGKEELSNRVFELSQLALHRLVLLSTREEGEVSFDVRSLQEYMAAAALTSGNPNVLEARLLEIARISHWRHVVLIAASRCFSDASLHHLRSMIINVPRNVELSGDDLLVRSGAQLSLDMFSDGLGVEYPNFRRQLAVHSLELLSLGVENFDSRLPTLCEDQTEEVVLASVRNRIDEITTPSAMAAWLLAFQLATRKPFHDLIVDRWPSDQIVIVLCSKLRFPILSTELIRKLHAAFLRIGPTDYLNQTKAFFGNLKTYLETIQNARGKSNHQILTGLDVQGALDSCSVQIPIMEKTVEAGPLKLNVILISRLEKIANRIDKSIVGTQDTALKAVLDFVIQPTHAQLANVLLNVETEGCLQRFKRLYNLMPWPLKSVAVKCECSDDLLSYAKQAGDGQLGDRASWIRAENRWLSNGFEEKDFLTDGPLWFSGLVDEVGMPFPHSIVTNIQHPNGLKTVLNLKFAEEKASEQKREQIRYLNAFSIHSVMTPFPGNSSEGLKLLSIIDASKNKGIDAGVFRFLPEELWTSRDFVVKVSELALASRFHDHRFVFEHTGPSEAVLKFPNQDGVLFLIALHSVYRQHNEIDLISPIQHVVHTSEDDSPRSQAAKKIIQICLGLVQDHELQNTVEIFCRTENLLTFVPIVKLLVGNITVPVDLRQKLSAAMVERLRTENPDKAREFVKLLDKCLHQRKSNLLSHSMWVDQLHLGENVYRLLQTLKVDEGGDVVKRV